MTTCGHCGNPQRGMAGVNGTPLCHPDTGPDCYRLVTVYHHPMPCPDCPGRRDLQSLGAFVDLLDEALRAARPAKPTAIHHINGNPYDNRPENLEIVDLAAHASTATPDAEETP